MDYRYIRQLLERYWKGETTLEEEQILRTFFIQKDIPEDMEVYRPLFAYESEEVKTDVLDAAFDERVLASIEEPAKVKAKVVRLPHVLWPLFKAAAVVAMFITISNAIQMSFDTDPTSAGLYNGSDYNRMQHGVSVAKADSASIDSMQQSIIRQVVATPYMK